MEKEQTAGDGIVSFKGKIVTENGIVDGFIAIEKGVIIETGEMVPPLG